MEEKVKLPTHFERNISRKLLVENIVYHKEILEEFFKQMGSYKGPFVKSMYVPHRELINRVKSIGIKLYKNRGNGRYYIYEERSTDPVLFNTELLDIPEETT